MGLEEIRKYEIGLDKNIKKRYGIEYIAIDYAVSMAELAIDKWLEKHSVKDLLNIKIYDPCAGTGILELALATVVSTKLKKENIEINISEWVSNCLYMADIDRQGIELLKQTLKADGITGKLNISTGDVLFNGLGKQEIIPAFDAKSWYWEEITGENDIDCTELDEFGEQVEFSSLRDNKEAYYKEALLLNGIDIADTSGLSICELDNIDVFKDNGGFDIVVMFAPDVKASNIAGNKDELAGYKSYNINANLELYFMEYGFSKLNSDGIAVILSNNAWIDAKYSVEFKGWIKDKLKYIIKIDNKNIMLLEHNSKWYKSASKYRSDLKYNLKRQVEENEMQHYDGVNIEVYDYIISGIIKKYKDMMLQSVVGDYTIFKGGLTIQDLKSLVVTEEMYNKYPGLIKKVYTYNSTEYIIALPKGIYTEDSIPSEIMKLLESRGKRDISDIELQYEADRINDAKNYMITDCLNMHSIENKSLVVGNNTVYGFADDWIINYLKNPIIQMLYSVCSTKYGASSINNIPVPLKLAENADISNDDIVREFGLTDIEVIKLGTMEELQ